jgi:hypothetical protein
MRRHGLRALLLLVVFAIAALGQTGTSMPSKDEIFELLNKAEEKVSGFEDAVKSLKPDLDKVDPKLSTNYLNAAAAAHSLIKAMKNRPSGYGLVGLIATMDDLSLDAATASVQLMIQITAGAQGPVNVSVLNPVILLMTSKNACNDISELIMHATLRYIHTEEDALEKLSRRK